MWNSCFKKMDIYFDNRQLQLTIVLPSECDLYIAYALCCKKSNTFYVRCLSCSEALNILSKIINKALLFGFCFTSSVHTLATDFNLQNYEDRPKSFDTQLITRISDML